MHVERRRKWQQKNKNATSYVYVGKQARNKWEAIRKEQGLSPSEFIEVLIESFLKREDRQSNDISNAAVAQPSSFHSDGTVTIHTTITLESSVECFLSVVHGTIKDTQVTSKEDITHTVKTVSADNNNHRQHVRISRVKKKRPVPTRTPEYLGVNANSAFQKRPVPTRTPENLGVNANSALQKTDDSKSVLLSFDSLPIRELGRTPENLGVSANSGFQVTDGSKSALLSFESLPISEQGRTPENLIVSANSGFQKTDGSKSALISLLTSPIREQKLPAYDPPVLHNPIPSAIGIEPFNNFSSLPTADQVVCIVSDSEPESPQCKAEACDLNDGGVENGEGGEVDDQKSSVLSDDIDIEESDDEAGESAVLTFTSTSGRPQRNVNRLVFRKRDVFSSDEDDEATPRKKRRGPVPRKKASTNDQSDSIDAIINSVAKGEGLEKGKGIRAQSDDSDYQPSDDPSKDLVSADENIEEDASSGVPEDEVDLEPVNFMNLGCIKSLNQELTDIVHKRMLYNKACSGAEANTSNVANPECDISSVSNPDCDTTSVPNAESDLPLTTEPDKDIDTDSESSDLFRLYELEIKSGKKTSTYTRFDLRYKHGAQVSSLVRYYTYSSHPDCRRLTCSVCGHKAHSSKLLIHIFCMHHKSTRFIEESYATSQKNAARLTELPLAEQELSDWQTLCMLCRKVMGSCHYANHVTQEHGELKTLRCFNENFGVESTILRAINENKLELDYISGLYVCNVCAVYGLEVLVNKTNASRHIQAHNDLALKCEVCQKSFNDLKAHTLKMHAELIVRCALCDFLTTQKTDLEEHIHVSHPFDLRCSQGDCTAKFTTEGAFRRHFVTEHLDPAERNTNYYRAEGESDQGLFGHALSAMKAIVNIPCHFCGKVLSAKLMRMNNKMGEHVENEHQEVLQSIPKEFRVVCKLCNKIFCILDNYKSHIMFCNKSRKCTYEGCGHVCRSLNALKFHLYDHKGRKCNCCDEVFASGKDLRMHKLRAHKPLARDFVCVECGKGFKRIDALKIHTFIHSGEKPLKCDYCDFRGRQRNNISSHVKVHHKDKLQEYLERNKDAS